MTAWLNKEQTTEELQAVYDADYYWYLRSAEFQRACLAPLAKMVNDIDLRCLDVACGEGQLAPLVQCGYLGFDGSTTAVTRASRRYPDRTFVVGRIEAPDFDWGQFGTIVFGNIMWVTIAKASHINMIKHYQQFGARYFIVYDLARLVTDHLETAFTLIHQHHATINLDLPPIKRHRKIMLFEYGD